MLRAIIVESDAEARAAVRRMLGSYPAVVVVDEFQTLAEAVSSGPGRHPDLVVAEIPYDPAVKDVGRAIKGVEALVRAAPEAAVFATGPMVSADFVLQVIRAGAFEFLSRPVEREALLGALEKVARLRRGAAPVRQMGRVISVYSTKGGLGVTTMAINLAVCLAELAPGRTVLVDLDTRQSDIATCLDLRPTYSVLDALENLDRLDESYLRGLLVKHPSGLLVLPGPTRMERVQLGGEQVRTGLEIMRSCFATVVLDLRHDMDTGTIAALEASDAILFLTSLDVCALRSGAAGLAMFRQLGLNLQKVQVIVMREDTGEDVTVKNARETLGLPVSWKTPSDYRTVVAAINGGEPVVTASPRSRIAKNLRQLGGQLAQRTDAGVVKSGASLARLVWSTKGSPTEG
jgi:pilus assembly protein CpaE